MARYLIASVCLALALAAGCDLFPVEGNAIRGTVRDAEGRPVAGAAVVLQHCTDPEPPGPLDLSMVGVHVLSTQTQRVVLYVVSEWGDTVRTYIDEVLPPQDRAVELDAYDGEGRLLPDGVYHVHWTFDGAVREETFPVLRGGYADVAGQPIVPLAVTGEDGRFSLGQDDLPFGYADRFLDESGDAVDYTVTRDVRVWAFDASGADAASDTTAVDPETGAEVDLTLGD